MKILLTGAAGFIGFHSAKALLEKGEEVIGIDNINDYYDISLKKARLGVLSRYENFQFLKEDISNFGRIESIFSEYNPKRVLHLAAQAGVRYSLKNPHPYISSNIQGFLNILEACRNNKVENLVYASSSSVYGLNKDMPFKESHHTDHPLSLYGASKKANELMAHSYSHLYELPTTGLRFFTVYGPWGRPDMALFLFTKAILSGKPLNIFNEGNMVRDFTYVDDVVEAIVKIINKVPLPSEDFDPYSPDPSISDSNYRIFNIGNNNPVDLMDYVKALETCLNMKAKKNFLPMQEGDVPVTAADTDLLDQWISFKPNTDILFGVGEFIKWYLDYYKVK